MSETRWKSRGLDDEENFNDAIKHIQLVIGVFEYLHVPQIQGNMREVFNLVFKELESFQAAVNTLRAEKGESMINITGQWEEFIQ